MLTLDLRWCLFAVCCTMACQVVPDAEVIQATDGDTVRIRVPHFPPPFDTLPLSVRVKGVDCPETGVRARCEAERKWGETAKAYTRTQLADRGSVRVEVCSWDKYGGRVLGDLLFPGDVRLSSLLIETHNAVAYSGRGPRMRWCDEEDEEDNEVCSS